jgi:hypothetical protein
MQVMPMRTIAALIVALAVLLPGESATAKTLRGLMQDCEQLESFWRLNPPRRPGFVAIPNQADPAICFGYLSALLDLRNMAAMGADCSQGWKKLNCYPVLGFCPPDSVSSDQVLAIFLAYARNNAALWHEDAGGHFTAALIRAFACKPETAAPDRN